MNTITSIQRSLEEAQRNFIRLVEEIPEGDWERNFDGESWTVKQEIVHIVQVLQILPAGINRAKAGGRRSLMSFIPSGLRGWINGRILVPVKARKESRASIVACYKEAHDEMLKVLGTLSEEDLGKGMPYPRKYRTVVQLAYRPVEHFEEHEAHIRQLLEKRTNVH